MLDQIKSYIMNRDGNRAVTQNIEEVQLTLDKKYDKPCLLSIHPDAEGELHLQLPSGDATIQAWQAIYGCYSVLQVYASGTTVPVSKIKLTR